jgi:hypothetical protein
MQCFELIRQYDVSGVSGTGKVLEGVIFETGVCVIHWMGPPPRGSINIFDNFEQFKLVHVDSHPENKSEIKWLKGDEQ